MIVIQIHKWKLFVLNYNSNVWRVNVLLTNSIELKVYAFKESSGRERSMLYKRMLFLIYKNGKTKRRRKSEQGRLNYIILLSQQSYEWRFSVRILFLFKIKKKNTRAKEILFFFKIYITISKYTPKGNPHSIRERKLKIVYIHYIQYTQHTIHWLGF